MFNIQITAIMKKINTLFLLLLGVLPMLAQEQSSRDVRLNEPNDIRAGLPIDVTKETSEVKIRYDRTFYYPGDFLTRLVFKGYNPGRELERHVTVQISTDIFGRNDFTTVYDGNCIIPSGGTSEECIPMLDVEFSSPLLMSEFPPLWVIVTSSGEPVDTPICFEQYVASEYSCTPTATFTIVSETFNYEGTVVDHDGLPVKGAEVSVPCAVLQKDFTVTTGEDGKFSVRLDDVNACYDIAVTAPGYPIYQSRPFYPNRVPDVWDYEDVMPKEIVLFGKLDFVAGRQATIVLPQAPDPSWGKYYRLLRHERGTVVFGREFEPKADTPYVLFPNEDFSIDLSDYDLSGLDDPDVVPFPDVSEDSYQMGFNGSYKNQPTRSDLYDGQFVFLVDSTRDCKSNSSYKKRIGACRAYLVAGAWSPEMKYEGPIYVFLDNETSDISEVSAPSSNLSCQTFDLQGRCLQGIPRKGLYIRNGKKYLVK